MTDAASVPPAQVLWQQISLPIGSALIGRTEDGALCRLSFLESQTVQETLTVWQKSWPRTGFKPDPTPVSAFDLKCLPILLIGTAFQRRVWQMILAIPEGATETYGSLAARLGVPRVARAVGGACGANPILYRIPCHRVILSNGKRGGFSGGETLKQKILESEKRRLHRLP